MKSILRTVIPIFLFFLVPAISLSQTFELYKSDTINRTDAAGMKQGKWMTINTGGKNKGFAEGAVVEELFYKDGKREGLRKQYHPNGRIKSEVNFKNNRPTGYSKFYYENGNLAEEGNWVYGGWDGKYKNYFEEGSVSSDLQYAYGKKDGIQKTYHSNGKLKIEGNWKNGAPDGIVKEFTDEGKLLSEEKYVNGQVDSSASKYYNKGVLITDNTIVQEGDSLGAFTGNGFFKQKNKFGKISKEGNFTNGQLMDGKQYYYTETGTLKKTIIYKEGKVVSTIEEK